MLASTCLSSPTSAFPMLGLQAFYLVGLMLTVKVDIHLKYFLLCVCVYKPWYVYRGQRATCGSGFLLSLCGSLELKSSHQACPLSNLSSPCMYLLMTLWNVKTYIHVLTQYCNSTMGSQGSMIAELQTSLGH